MAVFEKVGIPEALLGDPKVRATLLAYDRSGEYTDFRRALDLMDSFDVDSEHPPAGMVPP